MPKTEGQQEVAGVEIDPGGLLPHDAAYYMYMGSLRAPPCTEGVTWFVLKTSVDISADEIDAFATTAAPDSAKAFAVARPSPDAAPVTSATLF